MHSIIKGRGGAFLASAGVLILTCGFLIYALNLLQGPTGALKTLHASFISANGLSARAGVELGGVKVGRVTSIHLNSDLGVADVVFKVEKKLQLPSDTAVTIGASTMTGGNALQLIPGKSHSILEENGTISDARPPLSLEQQISNYIFNAGKL